jgi:hypothetical protein
MLLSYLIFSIPSTDFVFFSDIFSANFQPLENVLGLIQNLNQNLNQNLVAELAPLGLSDLSGLELAEVDVVFVSHAQRLDDFSDAVNGFRVFFQIFFHRRPGNRLENFENVEENLPKKCDFFRREPGVYT